MRVLLSLLPVNIDIVEVLYVLLSGTSQDAQYMCKMEEVQLIK